MLDASAVLALLFAEEGGAVVAHRLISASISAVSWGEVAQRIVEEGSGSDAVEDARGRLEAVGLVIEPYLCEDAEAAARLRPPTKHLGLSLADRSCLALALRLGLPALAADRAWANLPPDLRIDVEFVRG